MPRNHGFTLWELLWVLTIAAVLVGLGAPSLRTFLLDTRRTTDVNGLVLAIQLARSEAAKRGRPVVLCPSLDGLYCTAEPLGYTSGWIVFVNTDDDRPPRRGDAEPLLFVYKPKIEGSVTANRRLFEFRPFRKRSTNGTIVFCDVRGSSAARAVIVSYTGRPRVAPTSATGRPLVCAGLS